MLENVRRLVVAALVVAALVVAALVVVALAGGGAMAVVLLAALPAMQLDRAALPARPCCFACSSLLLTCAGSGG